MSFSTASLLLRGLIAALFFAHQSSFVANADGHVTKIMVLGSSVFIFGLESHPNPPTCSVAPNEVAASIETPGGRAMAALVLSAQAQGRELRVFGTGVCDVWSDRETVSFVYFNS